MSAYDYEYPLVFHKSKYFWKFVNRQMIIQDTESLNEGSEYKLLLFSTVPENIQDCIDQTTGCLKSSCIRTSQNTGGSLTPITEGVTNQSFELGIRWIDNGENGFALFANEDVEIAIANDTVFYVKAVILVRETGAETDDDNFVVAFARPSTALRCQNAITIAEGSEFIGHSSCAEA